MQSFFYSQAPLSSPIKQGTMTIHKDSGADRVMTSSLTMEVEAVTYAIQWLASEGDADYACHHSHRLSEPAAKSGVLDGLV